jgi:hypothetical protein
VKKSRVPRRSRIGPAASEHLVASRGTSLDRLIEELSTAALAAHDAENHDAEIRFRAMAAGADWQKALEILYRVLFEIRRFSRCV